MEDQAVERFASTLRDAKAGSTERWYHSDSLWNLPRMSELMKQAGGDLDVLAGGGPIADIGCGDGDCGFFLESLGYGVHLIDHAPTNFNHLQGAHALKRLLASQAEIVDIDLDKSFRLPEESYGLVLFLGLLYHLKNPYRAMALLSLHARHCFLSTRVARFAPDGTRIAELPVAYLLEEGEINDDPTNHWIFSHAGLKLLLKRTGWEVCAELTAGPENSEPVRLDRDERMFMLLRSKRQRFWPD